MKTGRADLLPRQEDIQETFGSPKGMRIYPIEVDPYHINASYLGEQGIRPIFPEQDRGPVLPVGSGNMEGEE